MAEVSHTRANYNRRLGPNAGNQSPAERSRVSRRRRTLIRRNSGLVPANGDALPSGQNNSGSNSEERSGAQSGTVVGIPVPAACFSWAPGNGRLVIRESISRFFSSAPVPTQVRMPLVRRVRVPVVGAVAVAGRQHQMEDAVAVKTNLCSPLINRRRPVHYLGVFDGHGGSHFAKMCKETVHGILKEELMGVKAGESRIGGNARPALPTPGLITDESAQQEAWRIVMSRVFARAEIVAFNTCECGRVGLQCSCDRSALTFSGTTAVAVVLTEKHFVVANCGDSRAVLYRGDRVIPLTFDHRPDRADEKARIQASGGLVVNVDTARVQGILAMSRAIGDLHLKPYVISEPEVTFTRRDEEDEFLIIATDGLWDVIPTDMAGRVAGECLRKQEAAAVGGDSQDLMNFVQPENDGPSGFPSRSASAASLLVRLALARKSFDNVSVVVVDLKRDVRLLVCDNM